MLEPFIWMFKIKKFRHVFIKTVIICALIIAFTPIICYSLFPSLNAGYVRVLIYSIISIPFLYILGYFWSLTENIIDRESDIRASNVFNNDIKVIYLIQPPELTIPQYIWRGIASIFACILMAIPYVALYQLSLTPENLRIFSESIRAALTIFFLSFIPILLWNYARRNSIVAVWNIRKAIYILGNYPWQYFCRMASILIILYVNFCIDNILLSNSVSNLNINPMQIFLFIVTYLVLLTKSQYFLYVIAYLLGTLAPEYEP